MGALGGCPQEITMPEVRFLKIFKGKPKYDNPIELYDVDSLKIIEADSFPHTEKGLTVIALVRVEPNFYGQFRIRIPDTSKDYWEVTVQNPKNELVWVNINYSDTSVTFDEPGEIVADLSLDGIPIHKTTLSAVLK